MKFRIQIGMALLVVMVSALGLFVLLPVEIDSDQYNKLILYAALLNAFATFTVAVGVIFEVERVMGELRR